MADHAVSRVAIVGGGVGGLATAIRLQSAGHHVTVFERNEVVGGKLATYVRDGYTFDIGPSLVTLARRVRRGVPRRGHDPHRPSRTRSGSTRSSAIDGPTVRRSRSPTGTTTPPRRSRRSRPVPATSGGRSTPAGAGSGTSRYARSSPGRCRTPGRSRSGCVRRSTSRRSTRCARCIVRPRRSSTIPAWCSGPTATPPTRVRRPTPLRPRWPASRTSRPASAAGIPWAGSTNCDRRSPGSPPRSASRSEPAPRSSPSRPANDVTGVLLADGTREPADIVVANTDAEHLYADLLHDRRRAGTGAAREALHQRVRAVPRRARPDPQPDAPQHLVLRELPRGVRPARCRASSPTTPRSTPACRR